MQRLLKNWIQTIPYGLLLRDYAARSNAQRGWVESEEQKIIENEYIKQYLSDISYLIFLRTEISALVTSENSVAIFVWYLLHFVSFGGTGSVEWGQTGSVHRVTEWWSWTRGFLLLFLVLVCLIHLSWKMKQIRTDTGSGAYYSQLGQTDIVFQAFLYIEKFFFCLFYFGLLRKGGRTSTGTKTKTKTQTIKHKHCWTFSRPDIIRSQIIETL